VSARKHDGLIDVRVTDDGPGIPPESLERIFELFYRDPHSSRAAAGSGIGLFVCASLVDAMGGRIWAAEPPGGGFEVGFTMRALEPDLADADAPPRPIREGAAGAAATVPTLTDGAGPAAAAPQSPEPALTKGTAPGG
jgi:hypothetical protein